MEQVFNKLVRDNIPYKIESNGEIAVTRILNDNEYEEELYKKLQEECNEVINSETIEEILGELADVLEVITAIAEFNQKSIYDVEEITRDKKLVRGGFEKRIFLEKTIDKK